MQPETFTEDILLFTPRALLYTAEGVLGQVVQGGRSEWRSGMYISVFYKIANDIKIIVAEKRKH